MGGLKNISSEGFDKPIYCPQYLFPLWEQAFWRKMKSIIKTRIQRRKIRNLKDLTILASIGKATEKVLKSNGYNTIGDIANANPHRLDAIPHLHSWMIEGANELLESVGGLFWDWKKIKVEYNI